MIHLLVLILFNVIIQPPKISSSRMIKCIYLNLGFANHEEDRPRRDKLTKTAELVNPVIYQPGFADATFEPSHAYVLTMPSVSTTTRLPVDIMFALRTDLFTAYT